MSGDPAQPYHIGASVVNPAGQVEVTIQGPGFADAGLRYAFGTVQEADTFVAILNTVFVQGMQKGRSIGIEKVLEKADDTMRPVARWGAIIFFGALTAYLSVVIVAVALGIDILARGASSLTGTERLLFLPVLVLTTVLSFIFFRAALKKKQREGR